jgi:predicted O-linked N-acetylglucosamine transferase (SPINDLY family)
LDGFVALNRPDFIERGLYWAAHTAELSKVRTGLREQWLKSPGRQPQSIAGGLESAFRHVWKRWCAGLPAESFAVDASKSEM